MTKDLFFFKGCSNYLKKVINCAAENLFKKDGLTTSSVGCAKQRF